MEILINGEEIWSGEGKWGWRGRCGWIKSAAGVSEVTKGEGAGAVARGWERDNGMTAACAPRPPPTSAPHSTLKGGSEITSK